MPYTAPLLAGETEEAAGGAIVVVRPATRLTTFPSEFMQRELLPFLTLPDRMLLRGVCRAIRADVEAGLTEADRDTLTLIPQIRTLQQPALLELGRQGQGVIGVFADRELGRRARRENFPRKYKECSIVMFILGAMVLVSGGLVYSAGTRTPAIDAIMSVGAAVVLASYVLFCRSVQLERGLSRVGVRVDYPVSNDSGNSSPGVWP